MTIPYAPPPPPPNGVPGVPGAPLNEKIQLAPSRVRVLIPVVIIAAVFQTAGSIAGLVSEVPAVGAAAQTAGTLAAAQKTGAIIGLIVALIVYALVLVLLSRQRPAGRVLATVCASVSLLANLGTGLILLGLGLVAAGILGLLLAVTCVVFLVLAWRRLRSWDVPR